MNKIKKLRQMMKDKTLDNIVITSPNNIFYLIGYSPNQLSVSLNHAIATLHITQDHVNLITMDYEAPFIKEKLSDEITVYPYTTWTGIKSYNHFLQPQETPKVSNSLSILQSLLLPGSIGLELDSVSYSFTQNFDSYVNVSSLLLAMRKIKDEKEIEVFKRLCSIQANALKEVALRIQPGITESELFSIYKHEVFQSNYALPSMWTMLTTGKNSAYLSTPTDRKVEENDMFKFDGGVNLGFQYFTTDMSRSFVIGNNETLAKIKRVLVDAQQKMIDAMKPGISCSDLFKIGMTYVQQFYPGYQRGHLGHSISFGPSTFEPPFINATDHTLLEPGMILCVEVPFYASDLGGMNIEDMVLITETGHEVLTSDVDHYQYENRLNQK